MPAAAAAATAGQPRARSCGRGNPREAAQRLHAGRGRAALGSCARGHGSAKRPCPRERAGPPGHAAGPAARGSSTPPPGSSILLPLTAAGKSTRRANELPRAQQAPKQGPAQRFPSVQPTRPRTPGWGSGRTRGRRRSRQRRPAAPHLAERSVGSHARDTRSAPPSQTGPQRAGAQGPAHGGGRRQEQAAGHPHSSNPL